ncbi:MAG TPA: phosphomannomutase [Candidatus Saccharimonadales bacterium]|nr:phosphomannomutase [Candidatus Saccharimonadales bacterium]
MPTVRESLSYEPSELKFGTSGLRGLVTEMTDLECYINTAGFLKFLVNAGHLQSGGTVYVAGDLRDSTPRITGAVIQAIQDGGYKPAYEGSIPTPAVAFYGLQHKTASIMVTGSHIPADRNGIKFNKADGEVLKADEAGIKEAVAQVRADLYAQDAETAAFDAQGMLKTPAVLPEAENAARDAYMQRHTDVFDGQTFAGKQIVFYQHSAVGRDMLVEMLQKLGAEVIPVGRSDIFVPIDSENVTPTDAAYFKQLSEEYPDAFAIVSTDGDSDRPFVVDENGVFHRGDELGAVVATWLKADAAAYPVSSSDAVDGYLNNNGVEWAHTRIGSPFVIVAMQEEQAKGKQRVVGWEVNGGFMLGVDLEVNGHNLAALPTRDAILPIIIALRAAIDAGGTVSSVFAALPQRFTGAGLIDNFPTEVSQKIVAQYSADNEQVHAALGQFFTSQHNFGAVEKIDALDGVRIFFDNGEIAHLRPSGNAPQLRIYSVADSQARADEIVALAIAEPDGIFRSIEKALSA